MSGAPENQDPEQLTADERERLELLAAELREVFTEEIAKLLRIHDAQRKRIAELERDGYVGPCPTCGRGYPAV